MKHKRAVATVAGVFVSLSVQELRVRYWRAMYLDERAIRLQPIGRSIRARRDAKAEARDVRSRLRALGVRP